MSLMMIVEKFGGAFLGILAGSAVIRMFYEILNYVIFLKNTGKGKQMEDIIEEFGSGFLTITVTLFLVGYWYENMRQGGAVYEFVRKEFLNCICGG